MRQVIFSSNAPMHVVAEALLSVGAQFNVAFGSYKGVTETSYIIQEPILEVIRLTTDLVADQESFLIVEDDRISVDGLPITFPVQRAKLIYSVDMNKEIDLGVFVSVDRESALAEEAFTFIPSQNVYLIAK